MALSSRNVYLDEECRRQALVLSQSLQKAQAAYAAGERQAEALKTLIRQEIATAPLAEIEYVEVVDALTMQPVADLAQPVMIAMAVRFKGTRLIDNILLG